MSDDIAVKRARAALLQAEIDAAEASGGVAAQPETPAAAAPPPPGDPAAAVPPGVAAAAAELAAGTTPGTPPGQLPPGIMTKEEMEAHEQRPGPKSWAEQEQQMAEGDRYIESFKYHEGVRS